MGGGKGGGGSSGPKKLSTRSDSSLNTIKTPGTIQYNSTERPVGVAFHNGRVFYFGLDIFGQPAVYFSQLLTDVDKAGLCYQEADPTAEEINDLVATDGGVLRPVGMGTPVAAVESDFGVLCFCSNGVWIIRGPEGSGFTATNFQVSKVTDKGCIGRQTIVDVSGAIIYFHEDGIIQLAPDEFGRIQATDLTNDSIKTLYLGFSGRDRSNAKGCYIESEKRAYWVIPSGQANGTYKHDARNVLVLATDLPGFYQWSLPATTANNALLLPFEDRAKTEVVAMETLTTTDGITAVTLVDGSTLVTSEVRFVEEGDTLPLFMTSRQESTTFPVEFHHPTSNSFSDFGSQDYTSFVEFGYQYASSKATGLSAPYIHSFFKRGRALPFYGFDRTLAPATFTDPGVMVLSSVETRYLDTHGEGVVLPDTIDGIVGVPAMSADGLKLFVPYELYGASTVVITEWVLSSPYEVENPTYTGNFYEVPGTGAYLLRRILLSADGNMLYMFPFFEGTLPIKQLALAQPNSLQAAPLVTDIPNTLDAHIYDGLFSVDGMYYLQWDSTVVYGTTGNARVFNLRRWDLSSPFMISGATLAQVAAIDVGQHQDIKGRAFAPRAAAFSEDGTSLKITFTSAFSDVSSERVVMVEVKLASPYDITSSGEVRLRGIVTAGLMPESATMLQPWIKGIWPLSAYGMFTTVSFPAPYGWASTGNAAPMYAVVCVYRYADFDGMAGRPNTVPPSTMYLTSEEPGVNQTQFGLVTASGYGDIVDADEMAINFSVLAGYGPYGVSGKGHYSQIITTVLRGPSYAGAPTTEEPYPGLMCGEGYFINNVTPHAKHITASISYRPLAFGNLVGNVVTGAMTGRPTAYDWWVGFQSYGSWYDLPAPPDKFRVVITDLETGSQLFNFVVWRRIYEPLEGSAFEPAYAYSTTPAQTLDFVDAGAVDYAGTTEFWRYFGITDEAITLGDNQPGKDVLLEHRGKYVIVDILEEA